jgi:hypothetical protein
MANAPESPNSSGAPEPTSSMNVRRPLLWLLAILAVGLTLRVLPLREPLQRDEFPSVYAVAERRTEASPNHTPAASDPLTAVASWDEVRQRSVLPFGIVNPIPVYHFVHYVVAQMLPITEWSMRLPSLLAGLGCVAGVYFLCRRFLGDEVALVAALFAAVDPIQVTTSTLVGPAALGNLACLLSFAALLGVLYGKTLREQMICSIGYGLSVAVIGYLNGVLLLVVVAHAGLVAYRLLNPDPTEGRRPSSLMAWLGGCALATLLLVPQMGYFVEVAQFAQAHQGYLFLLGELRLTGIMLHNSSFLVALLIVSLASYVARQIQLGQQEAAETAVVGASVGASAGTAVLEAPAPPAAPAPREPAAELPPPPDSPDLVWLGRVWFFWPQIAALLQAYGLGQALFVSRFLGYTTLGGVILLAYWATRERTRDMRLGVAAAVALTIFLWGLLPVGRGFGLVSPSTSWLAMRHVDELEQKKGSWKPGDVLLVRSSYPEADFLPDGLPEANRRHVVGALLSPYTTLYVSEKPRPVVLLSKSQRRGDKLQTDAGPEYDPTTRYDAKLAEELRGYNQFWIASNDDADRKDFVACFLPWLADALGSDLQVARNRQGPERYFDVYTDTATSDYMEGLTDASRSDFTHLVRVQRRRPPWAFGVGGVTAVPVTGSPAALAVQAWRLGQQRTPRVTELPQEDLSAYLNAPER